MKKILLSLTACLALLTGCGIDNYDEPTGSIAGGIYDAETQELIPAQSPNGARVQVTQDGYSQPTNFWCKPDGSFENTRLFSGKYKLSVQGPFVASTITEQEVNVPSSNIKVMVEPYLRITATAKLNGKTLDIDYTVNQNSKSTGTVGMIEILCGNTIGLSVTTSKKRAKISTDDQPIGQQHHYTMENVDTKGAVFVRVAAKTSETSYYNYSTLLKLK